VKCKVSFGVELYCDEMNNGQLEGYIYLRLLVAGSKDEEILRVGETD